MAKPMVKFREILPENCIERSTGEHSNFLLPRSGFDAHFTQETGRTSKATHTGLSLSMGIRLKGPVSWSKPHPARLTESE